MSAVIDKLEVRVPAAVPYATEFSRLYREVRGDPAVDPFRPSRHYDLVGDLREFDYSVILHAHCKRTKPANHKLELVDVGRMSLSEMLNEIERVFAVHANDLDVMRIDLAADVFDLPVTWFREHLRIAYKQFASGIGIEFTEMGKRGIQTLYYGRRPNCYRVYDKIAEYKAEYGRLIRRIEAGSQLPTFEEFSGYSAGQVVTRIERQIGAGTVPCLLHSVRDLKKAERFNPFERIQIAPGGKREPQPGDYRIGDYLAGQGLRQVILENGLQTARALLNKYSRGNASRLLRKYEDFLPSDEVAPITTEHLFQLYSESVARQLAA